MRDSHGRFLPGPDPDRADNDADEARDAAAEYGRRGGRISPGNFKRCPERASECGKKERKIYR
jgi:general stress protein YciG